MGRARREPELLGSLENGASLREELEQPPLRGVESRGPSGGPESGRGRLGHASATLGLCASPVIGVCANLLGVLPRQDDRGGGRRDAERHTGGGEPAVEVRRE